MGTDGHCPRRLNYNVLKSMPFSKKISIDKCPYQKHSFLPCPMPARFRE